MLVRSALFAIVVPVVVALIATRLPSVLASAAPLAVILRRPSRGPAIRFGVDTFAFPNESRTKNRGKPDLYANYCFVMVRAVTQFHRFARFDPDRADARVRGSVAYDDRDTHTGRTGQDFAGRHRPATTPCRRHLWTLAREPGAAREDRDLLQLVLHI